MSTAKAPAAPSGRICEKLSRNMTMMGQTICAPDRVHTYPVSCMTPASIK